MRAALVEHRLSRQTVAVTGPEEMPLTEAVRRVARAVNRRPLMFPLPVWWHYWFAWFCERTMRIPLISTAQVRILSEGLVEALPPCDELPDDLKPRRPFSDEQIRAGLPRAARFGLADCRFLNFKSRGA
jgi:NADH dehydrogenase